MISSKVAALTEGVIKTMWLARLKITMAAGLALAVLGTGVGVVSYRTLAVQPDQRRAPAAQADERKAENPRGERPAAGERAGAGERGREPRKAPSFQGKITAISGDGKVLSLEIPQGRGEESEPHEDGSRQSKSFARHGNTLSFPGRSTTRPRAAKEMATPTR